jgi:hypothetical protein
MKFSKWGSNFLIIKIRKLPGINTHTCVYQIVGIIPAGDNCLVLIINSMKLIKVPIPNKINALFDLEISFRKLPNTNKDNMMKTSPQEPLIFH